jgi:hypothetical protein
MSWYSELANEKRRLIKEAGGEPYQALLAKERAARAHWRKSNADKIREQRNEHRRLFGRPWKTWTVKNARIRGRKAGMKSTITVADLHWPTHCPVLGIKLFYPMRNGEIGKARPDLPTLDRWDNTKGYVPGNVYVISMRANALKSNATSAELRKIADYAEWGANSLFGRSAHV